jgi:hypothetical protein
MRAVSWRKRSLLAPRPILHNSKSYCSLVVSIHAHGGLMCCGVFSILLGYICSFSNVSDAFTNRGLGVAVRSIWVDAEGSNGMFWVCDDSDCRLHVVQFQHFGQGR